MVAQVEFPHRRPRRARRPVLDEATAIQVFVFEHDAFVGTEVFGLEGGVVIGRHPVCDLRLDADTVSREHARLWVEDGVVLVRDLHSGNGLFMDRRRVEGPTELGPRDTLQIGPFTLRARPLAPRPSTPVDLARAEDDTRLEALLGAENTGGTRELPIDLEEATPHLRLIEAALSRQAPSAPRRAPEPPTPQPLTPAADASAERRLRDLDDLLAGLGGRRPSVVPWRAAPAHPLDTNEYRRDLASPLAVGGVLAAPSPERAASRPPPADPLLFEPMILTPDEEDTEAELAEPAPAAPVLIEAEATEASSSGPLGVFGAVPSSPVEARLVTPSDLRVSVGPAPRSTREAPPTRRAPPARAFDAVEIIATRAEEVVDIAVLRSGGQQYVLGHPTPQGHLAPFATHEGLRLVRLHPDTSADLVFPRDVRGTLDRGDERVRLEDLTEQRKYSCLRLEVGDRAEVRLGHGAEELVYRLSFRTRPLTLFGGRRAPPNRLGVATVDRST